MVPGGVPVMSADGNRLKATCYRHRGCGGDIVASLDGESCGTCGAGIASDDEMYEASELPELADASEEDLRLAIASVATLATYGGFLRAALAGIYAERARRAHQPAEAS